MVQARANGDPPFIGPFQVLGRLGKGGFGTVYAASTSAWGWRGPTVDLAAVKVAHPYLADSPDFRSRFAKEIAAIRRVRSPFVPKLIDERSDDEYLWLATELIPGPSLEKVVIAYGGPLPTAMVWQLGAGIAEALEAIHSAPARVIHRDLKPQNVLVTAERPWIIDFGLAHLTENPHQPSSVFPMATYGYAAPEQLKEGLAGAGTPADIFALGGTLLFAATGHPPHEADSKESLFIKAQTADPNLAGLPRELYGLVESCLLRSPDARPTLADLRAEFARYLRTHRGRGSFASTLPAEVHTLLESYHRELRQLSEARVPSRTWQGGPGVPAAQQQGWDQAGASGVSTALPGIRSFAPSPAPEETRILAPSGLAWEHALVGNTADTTILQHRAPETEQRTAALGGFAANRAGDAVRHGRTRQGEQWTLDFDSWICSEVAVHGDLCVVGCLAGTVEVIRVTDGVPEQWSPVKLGGAPDRRVYDAVAIAPGGSGAGSAAYVAVGDGSVYAIDLDSGQAVQALPPGAAIEGRPVVVPDMVAPRVYLIRADGTLYAIDPRTHEPSVIHEVTDGASGALAVAGDVIFAGDRAGRVHQIDAVTGRSLSWVMTDGQVFAAPLPVADSVYIAGTDRKLRQVTVPDGTVLGWADLGAPVHAPPVHDAGRIFVGDGAGRVHAYEPDDSGVGLAAAWPPLDLGVEVTGLAVADGLLYAANGYKVTVIDGWTGQIRSTLVELDCLVGAAPVISGQFAYIVGLGGVVRRVSL